MSTNAQILEHAARRAVLAPSIHNTQPWRFTVSGDTLELHADTDRRLAALDPRGRQLLISCGCALFHVRVALQAAGREPSVHRFPAERRPDLLARVRVGRPGIFPGSDKLDRAIDDRHTNRRQFIGDAVPETMIAQLQWIARTEGALLVPITRPEDIATLAAASEFADGVEMADPDYLAEIARWTTSDPRRDDGVQLADVPRGGDDRSGLLVREFDPLGLGWLPPPRAGDSRRETLLLLCATIDERSAWLRVGEALERIWLTLTAAGFAASPLTQAVEVRAAYQLLRNRLKLNAYPQIVLRVGHAPAAASARRRRADDLIEHLG